MNEIKFGIIGSGFMGRTYAEVITRYVPDARLVGVSGGSRASALAADYQVTHVEHWEDLCRDADLHALIIASPHMFHASQAMAAIQADRHVMIEKPMSASVDDCVQIVHAAQRQDIRSSVAFTQRKRLCNKRAKQIIDSGAIGRPVHIQGWHVVGSGTSSLPKWQSSPDNVGVLLGHGIHLFDAVRWFTGREIEKVTGFCRNTSADYAVEASSDVLLELEGGCRANLMCSFEGPTPGFPSTQFGFRITCEKGLLDLDAYGALRMSAEGSAFEEIERQAPIDWQSKGFLDPVRLESYSEHVSEFCQSIRERRNLGADARDGLQAVAAVFAAYVSNERGAVVQPASLITA